MVAGRRSHGISTVSSGMGNEKQRETKSRGTTRRSRRNIRGCAATIRDSARVEAIKFNLLRKAALIFNNFKSLETRSRFYQSDVFQRSRCLKNFIPGKPASCYDDHFRQTEVFSEFFEIQTVGVVFKCREETNFLFIGPVRKFSDNPGCSVTELRSVRQWQTIIDVIDLSAVNVRNLKTKADSAMFITVMRPNNRVAPVRTKAKHAMRSGPSRPCVIQCRRFNPRTTASYKDSA